MYVNYIITCVCTSVLLSELRTCNFILDIDECEYGIDECQHICNNINGSFYCSCNPGYTLNPDSTNCTGEYNYMFTHVM